MITRYRETAPEKPFQPPALSVAGNLAAGVAVSFGLYMILNGGLRQEAYKNLALLAWLAVDAGVAFFIFKVCRKLFRSDIWTAIIGSLISYAVFFGIIFAQAAIAGNFAETYMWWPVMVIFGAPITAPVIAGAWWAATRKGRG